MAPADTTIRWWCPGVDVFSNFRVAVPPHAMLCIQPVYFRELILGQIGKFVLSSPFRESPVVGIQKTKEVVDSTIRHVDDLRHPAAKGVVGPKIRRLPGQVFFYRLCYAR